MDARVPFDAGVAEVPCFEAPRAGSAAVRASLTTEADLARADVAFLIDSTASMRDEIEQVRKRLRDTLAPAINESIPDVQFVVGTFADFPVEPYGESGVDRPFVLRLPSSPDVARAQGAVDAIELGDGRDPPESHVQALWHLATGRGFGAGASATVPPSQGCPAGGLGYACFRRDSLPVVLLFTDAPFHNGPERRHRYRASRVASPGGDRPAEYAEMLEVVSEIDMRVMGFNSGEDASRRDMSRLARDTGAVGAAGDPLVFPVRADGKRLSREVVTAIKTFADTVVLDVGAEVRDGDRSDGVDATRFIEAVAPVSATPEDQVDSIDREAGVFRGVRAGTRVTFDLIIRSGAAVGGREPRSFRLDVVFRGDGRAHLGQRTVRIVVPGEDGGGCGPF